MNSKPTMIAVFIGLIIFAPLMFYLKGIPIFYAFILTAIVGLFFIFVSIKEKKDDKKAQLLKDRIIDESYFNSAEWREKYLSRVTEDFFEIPDKKGMKADLTKRYHRMVSIPFMLMGIFMIVGSFCVFFVEFEFTNIFYFIFGLLIGLFLLYSFGIKYIIAVPLRNFYKNNPDCSDIEFSYVSGKILSNKDYRNGKGINIGGKYTVIYNKDAVYAIENNQISNVSKTIIRLKNYMDNIYAGEQYKFKLNIIADMVYSVELDEYQVEAALSELRALAGDADKTAYKEKTENEIVV